MLSDRDGSPNRMALIDVYAVAAAISLGTLSVLHALAWRVQHQRWYVSFGVAYLTCRWS
jgi:hypothetical protein